MRPDDPGQVLVKVLEGRLRETFERFCADIPQILASMPRAGAPAPGADDAAAFVRALLEYVGAVPSRRAQAARYLLIWYAKTLAGKDEREAPGAGIAAELIRARLSPRELEAVDAALAAGWESLRYGGSLKTLAARQRKEMTASLSADDRRRFGPYLAALLPPLALGALAPSAAEAGVAGSSPPGTGAGWLGVVTVVAGVPLVASFGWCAVRGSEATPAGRAGDERGDASHRRSAQPAAFRARSHGATVVAVETAREIPAPATAGAPGAGSGGARRRWIRRVSGTTANLTGVAWSGSRAVAVGESGTLITSSDGVEWQVAAAPPTYFFLDVAFGDGVFVAVGSCRHGTNGGRLIVTSADGLTWDPLAEPEWPHLGRVAFGNGVFVAAGQNSALTSRDGERWTAAELGTGEYIPWMDFHDDRFVVVTQDARTIVTSADGARWSTAARHPAGVPPADTSSTVARAAGGLEDGEPVGWSWRPLDVLFSSVRRPPAEGERMRTAFDGHELILVANGIWSTADGERWTAEVGPDAIAARDAVWTGARFIVVGHDGAILTSEPAP